MLIVFGSCTSQSSLKRVVKVGLLPISEELLSHKQQEKIEKMIPEKLKQQFSWF